MKKTLFLYVALFFLIISSGCKKENSPTQTENKPVELRDNVVVIDTNKLVLDERASDFPNGTYVFTVIDSLSAIQPGDVLVGYTGEGYIRKVTEVAQAGGKITFHTIQAAMSDIFKKGRINFAFDMDDMRPKRLAAFTYNIADKNLYQNSFLNVDVISANLSLDPQWNFDFDFEDSGIQYFEMSTNGSSWQSDVKLEVTAHQAASLINRQDTLASYEKKYVKWVSAGFLLVPVVVRLDIDWLAEYSLEVDASVTNTVEASCNGSLTLGVKYANNEWQGLYDFSPVTTTDASNREGNATLSLTCALRPVITAKLYGVAGPHASVALMTNLTGTAGFIPTFDWDIKSSVWLQAAVGADVTILGHTLASYPDRIWETSKLTYQTPDSLQLISGNNQTGAEDQVLPQPCKIQVLDSKGLPVKGAPVYFKVLDGGGSVNPASGMTDQNGYAQSAWTLGAQQSIQHLRVEVKYGNHSAIRNAPAEFIARATVDSLLGTWNCTSWTLPNGQDGFHYTLAGTTVTCPYPLGVQSAATDTTVNHSQLSFTFSNNGNCQYNRQGSYSNQLLLNNGTMCTLGTSSNTSVYAAGSYLVYPYSRPSADNVIINGITYTIQWVNANTIVLRGVLPDRKLLPAGSSQLTLVK